MTYRDALYDSYVTEHQGQIDERWEQPSLKRDVIARLPEDRSAAVLDLGCGQGQLVRLICEHGYSNVLGIDISPQQIALARELGASNVAQADLFGHAERNPATYDAVTAIDVLEHFDRADVIPAFAAIALMLKPGGRLILRSPNGSSPYSGRIFYSDLTHGVAYTARSLAQVAAAAGFAQAQAYPVRPAGSSPRERLRRALWPIIEAGFILPLIIETGRLRGHIVTQNLIGVAIKP